MTINYTSLLSLAEPVTGTESGTWGDDVNKGITDYLDIAIAGTNTISTDGDVTLTLTSGSSSGNGIVSTTAQYAMLLMSGSRTAARNVTVPASSRYYIVFNNTTGGYAVTVRGAGPTTGVSIANGEKALVAWNGTDYVKISNTSGAGVFSSITNTGLTSGRVVYSTTGGLETDSANLTFNGTTLTANTLNLTNALGTAYGGTGLTSFTANGILYASSTSALATGSALTFDGASNFSYGGSNASTYNTLNVNNTASNGYSRILFNIGASGANGVGAIKYAPGIFFAIGTDSDSSSTPIVFNLNSSEQMRLTSTGLGIGTSSPAYKLDVSGSGRFSGSSATVIANANNGTTATFQWTQAGVGNWLKYFRTSDSALVEQYGGTDLLFLSTSGNLGLGVTPSAWYANSQAIQNSSGSFWQYGGGNIYLGQNYYLNGSLQRIYSTTAAATEYNQSGGAHRWYTAPSGTAGNAITFSQVMTLDASGNLGVGTTSPSARLAVTSGDVLNTVFNTTRSSGSYLQFNLGNSGVNLGYIGSAGQVFTGGSTNDFAIRTEANLTFGTGSTERARIDSSGNFAINTTTIGNSNSKSFVFSATSGYIVVNHASGQASGSGYASFGYNAGEVGSITQNGTTGVLYNTSSDYRLKTVIGAVSDSGSRIDALEPVEYEWKANGKRTRGFLAHKFQEVYAGSVTGEKDAVDAEGKPVYQAMQASSPEVIADLVAEIQSLRKRLAAAGIA